MTVSTHKCEICKEEYGSLGEAEKCQSQGDSQGLPRGTFFGRSEHDGQDVKTMKDIWILTHPRERIEKRTHAVLCKALELSGRFYFPEHFLETKTLGGKLYLPFWYLGSGHYATQLSSSDLETFCEVHPDFRKVLDWVNSWSDAYGKAGGVRWTE